MEYSFKEKIAIGVLSLMMHSDLSSVAERYISSMKNIARNRETSKKFVSFLKSRLDHSIEVIDIDEELDEVAIAQIILNKNFDGMSAEERNMVILCFLCDAYSQSGEQAIYRNICALSEPYLSCDIVQNTKKMLSCYYNMILNSKKTKEISELFANLDNYQEVFSDFAETYAKSYKLLCYLKGKIDDSEKKTQQLEEQLRLSERVSKTLKRVYRFGLFSTLGINQETAKKIEDEIMASRTMSRSYLVLISATKDAEQIKNYVNSLPGFFPTGGSRMKNITGFEGDKTLFSMNVIMSELPPAEFKRKIESMEKPNTNRVVVIVPLDPKNMLQYSRRTGTKEEWMMKMERAFNQVKGMEELSDEEFWNMLTRLKISSEELLSVLPFNIFVPDLESVEEEFIIKNYQKIKEALGIKTISDWADKSLDMLTEQLLANGTPKYADENKTNNFPTRAKEISKQIISNCSIFREQIL